MVYAVIFNLTLSHLYNHLSILRDRMLASILAILDYLSLLRDEPGADLCISWWILATPSMSPKFLAYKATYT